MKNLFAKPSVLLRCAAFVAVALVGISAVHPAMADPRGRHVVARHNDWDRHVRQAHDWHRHAPPPGVVYAPPAVYEAPPPQPSGLNLIIPFNIR